MTRLLRALFVVIVPAVLFAQDSRTFRHSLHAKLFPTCLGCHAGITSGDSTRAFPAATLCGGCHDGTIRKRVDWMPPAPRGVGLLAFSHVTHAKRTDEETTCPVCHAVADTAQWMIVARPAPERCLTCHAHVAPAHLADENKCTTCHRTLAGAVALSNQRVAALPKPPSHSRANHVSTHGAATRGGTATCATCHARESCARCHVDAGRSAVIATLPNDARVARFVAAKAPSYPTPADHRRTEFSTEHGPLARASVTRCAACHARPSCATCHTGEGAREVLDQLPDAKEAAGRGVRLRVSASASHPADGRTTSRQRDTTQHTVLVHATGFARAHGAAASAGAMSCAGCHAQRVCNDCHTGERSTRRYHPSNFVSRHAPESYSRDMECSSCHATEVFCRDCHRQTGLAPLGGSRSTRYHNAQPRWLLQHGRAARQELASCTACHQQTYCMQCHSDVGWRVNPHGPDFDAAHMRKRNPTMCVRCHFKDPLGGK